jgi:hypothetical protein
MGIEHILPQSTNHSEKHFYRNCVYCCQMCNRARSTKPSEDKTKRKLLNPTKEAWQSHFTCANDKLSPAAGDVDAEYTHTAYDLDDPRKVSLRRLRRETHDALLEVLGTHPTKEKYLLDLASDLTRDPHEHSQFIEIARTLRASINRARLTLETYLAIPKDAPASCRCGTTKQLPAVIDSQMADV